MEEGGVSDVTNDWDRGHWLNPPLSAEVERGELIVAAAADTDFWRVTAYGFVHDNGHALLERWPTGTAVEVSFIVDFDQQFDQAGLFIRHDETIWVKAGVEFSDGIPQLGAVVTDGRSDWSVAPVPEWSGGDVTIRVSWVGDAITIRARRGDDPWRLMRVAPWPVDAETSAGPFCCAPTRSGLRVRFTRWATGEADQALHP
jgi:uncharacterized protein